MPHRAAYNWDNKPRMMQMAYPVNGMQDLTGGGTSGPSVASATYGVAGQMDSMSYFGYSESRQYNSMFQMTRQTVIGQMDMQYVFDASGQNNGRIIQSIDGIAGET